jgi:tetratricopeptide (TPR) repeat protein
MRWVRISAIGLTAGLAFGATPLAAQPAHDHSDHAHAVLGKVDFPVTCNSRAKALFNEGMKLQHSFWYAPARETFQKVVEADPKCVMGYWGQALSLLNNPFTPPLAENLREGKALLAKAQAVGAKTPREAGYIAALSVLFAGDDLPGHPARIAQYKDAMAGHYERFPKDPEAAIYYALSLIMAAPATDKTYANPLAAAQILEREFARQPQHPGVAHYTIHTYDVPALASRGVAAAERYSTIAADAPHALHMPSHIFTRVGRWEDSIRTNRRSADIAVSRGEVFDAVHAMDYMVYAYLQTAQPDAAQAVLKEMDKFSEWKLDRPIAGYAFTAMPARYMLERGDWRGAAQLKTRTYGIPYVDATTHFARALGAARSGDPASAKADIEALKADAAALQGKDAYWYEQVDILRVAAEGWAEFASGGRDKGLALLREASEREARTEKHPVTPGPLVPAREQYAEMLTLAGRHAEALSEFGTVLKTEPRRLRAVYGAARSAELAGANDAATRYYAELVQIASPARESQPALIAAKAFVDRR